MSASVHEKLFDRRSCAWFCAWIFVFNSVVFMFFGTLIFVYFSAADSILFESRYLFHVSRLLVTGIPLAAMLGALYSVPIYHHESLRRNSEHSTVVPGVLMALILLPWMFLRHVFPTWSERWILRLYHIPIILGSLILISSATNSIDPSKGEVLRVSIFCFVVATPYSLGLASYKVGELIDAKRMPSRMEPLRFQFSLNAMLILVLLIGFWVCFLIKMY